MNLLEQRWFQQLALLITIASAVTVLYISFLLLWPADPIQVVQPYHVLTPQVAQGTRLVYEVEYCIKKPITFTVHRELLNLKTRELWMVADRVNILEAGCQKENHGLITPLRADLGPYKMLATVVVQINPLRFITYHYETEEFNITEPTVNLQGIIK